MKKTNPTNIPTITKTYVQLSDENLGPELDRYVSGLTDNTYFPTITLQVADYTAKVTKFRDLQAEASATRDKNLGLKRDTARNEAILATIAISNTVTELADGNLEALASTNLPMRKSRTPIVPEGPGAFTLKASEIAGQLAVKMKRTKGTFLIVARYTLAPVDGKANWITVYSTTAQFSIYDLQPGSKYFVQLGVIIKGAVTLWGDTLLSPYINDEKEV